MDDAQNRKSIHRVRPSGAIQTVGQMHHLVITLQSGLKAKTDAATVRMLSGIPTYVVQRQFVLTCKKPSVSVVVEHGTASTTSAHV